MTLAERLTLEALEQISLGNGSHDSREAGVCAMEAVAWMAGEKHTDHPACASQMIATFLRTWNDRLQTDDDRNSLIRPLVPLVVNTRGSVDLENRRAMRIYDWLVRDFTPAWLDLRPELTEHATALRALAPLVDEASARAAQPTSEAASVAAAAAGAAAWAAARDAAWAAAWAAAGAAAWAALKPTMERLQLSAQALVRELCEMKDAA